MKQIKLTPATGANQIALRWHNWLLIGAFCICANPHGDLRHDPRESSKKQSANPSQSEGSDQ